MSREMPAHRLDDDRDVGKRESAAAEALRHGDAEPAQLSYLAPKLPIDPRLRRDLPADGCCGTFLAEKIRRDVEQHRLLIGERDLVTQLRHRISPSAVRAHVRR